MATKVQYAGLDKAISIAAVAFEGKFDKGGIPYIMHCLHVMHGIKEFGVQAQIAAVLHDLLEDTMISAEELIDAGFDPRTVELIVLLTHIDGENYDDYIMRLSVSTVATAIKMADLRHNSDIHRMKGLRDKDIARIEKYHKAYAFLKGIIENE